MKKLLLKRETLTAKLERAMDLREVKGGAPPISRRCETYYPLCSTI